MLKKMDAKKMEQKKFTINKNKRITSKSNKKGWTGILVREQSSSSTINVVSDEH